MDTDTLRIYDTSLRDGLRNSGIAIDLDDKIRFLQQLERLGVSDIEVGFGGPSQVETMTRLADTVTRPVLYGLSRVNRRDVDRVLESLAAARHPGANIFSPVSDAFLKHAGKSAERALQETVRAVEHARARVEHVMFSAQDAPRADRAFLIEISQAAIEAGATGISIADTTSQAMPDAFGDFIGRLRAGVAGADGVLWSVHCHNDLGLAVANCAAAIARGARQVECTVSGIGERNGNTPMQAMVRLLNKRQDAFPGLACTVDAGDFAATEALLADIAKPAEDAGSGVVELLRRHG